MDKVIMQKRLNFNSTIYGNYDIWVTEKQNQQTDLCAQHRLRSAWSSVQSDQILRCPDEEIWGPLLPIKRTSKTLIRLGFFN